MLTAVPVPFRAMGRLVGMVISPAFRSLVTARRTLLKLFPHSPAIVGPDGQHLPQVSICLNSADATRRSVSLNVHSGEKMWSNQRRRSEEAIQLTVRSQSRATSASRPETSVSNGLGTAKRVAFLSSVLFCVFVLQPRPRAGVRVFIS